MLVKIWKDIRPDFMVNHMFGNPLANISIELRLT